MHIKKQYPDAEKARQTDYCSVCRAHFFAAVRAGYSANDLRTTVVLLLTQPLQLFAVRYPYRPAGQLHGALPAKIFKHSCHHLACGAEVRGNLLVRYRQVSVSSSALSSRRNPARRLSKLFHITCSISHMTSVKTRAHYLTRIVGDHCRTLHNIFVCVGGYQPCLRVLLGRYGDIKLYVFHYA